MRHSIICHSAAQQGAPHQARTCTHARRRTKQGHRSSRRAPWPRSARAWRAWRPPPRAAPNRRRGGSSTDAHLGVQSGSRARSERVDRADLGAQHRQQETRTRREPHRRRRSSRVPSKGRRELRTDVNFEREKISSPGRSQDVVRGGRVKTLSFGKFGFRHKLFSMDKRGICQKENWRSARNSVRDHAEIFERPGFGDTVSLALANRAPPPPHAPPWASSASSSAN